METGAIIAIIALCAMVLYLLFVFIRGIRWFFKSLFGLSVKAKPQTLEEPLPDPAVSDPTPASPQSIPDVRTLMSTGTGFVVNRNYIVTSYHVVENSELVTVRHRHKEILAEVAAIDSQNDLALLQIDATLPSQAVLRSGKSVREGEFVANYGYPIHGHLSDSAKISTGVINSLAGPGNDSRLMQYDAATQPGNSGGPVLDQSGNVVGIVRGGLNLDWARETGSIAQNVTFAYKSDLIESFLSANGVDYVKGSHTTPIEPPEIAEKAAKFTVLVSSWALHEQGAQTRKPSSTREERRQVKQRKKIEKQQAKRDAREEKRLAKEKQKRANSRRAMKIFCWMIALVIAGFFILNN